jgi:hypothetical protein
MWSIVVILAIVLVFYFILRTPRFWKEVENLLEYPSLFETRPTAPGEAHMHLHSKQHDIHYYRGHPDVDGFRVEKEGRFSFWVSYSDGRIVEFTKSGQRQQLSPNLAQWQQSLLLDLRDRVRAEFKNRTSSHA